MAFIGLDDLISKKALMDDICTANGCKMSCDDCEKINCLTGAVIDRRPIIEAEQVWHGHWEKCDLKKLEHGFIESIPDGGICCSECRCGFPKQYTWWNYCPNCGAEMDLEVN
jgi:hypothetical protein